MAASKITSDPMEVDVWQRRRERKEGQERRQINVKKEGQHQNQSPNPCKDVVCWHCGMKSHLRTDSVGRIQRIGPAPAKLKTKEVKENRRTPQAREQARWHKEPQPALASPLDLASIETLVRSPHLDQEGRDGHVTQVLRFRHVRWMQGLARNARE